MTVKTGKKNIALIASFTGLAAVLLISVIFFVISMIKNAKLNGEFSSKCRMIDSFVKQSKMPVTEESIENLKVELKRLDEAYKTLRPFMRSPLTKNRAVKKLDPLRFKERLIQTQKKLRAQALKNNLIIGGTLGFSRYETELPSQDQIPELYNRLEILEELLTIFTHTGIESLERIEFENIPKSGPDDKKKAASRKKRRSGPGTPYEEQKPEFYSQIPIYVVINCTTAQAIDILYQMRVSPCLFEVKEMDLLGKEVKEGPREGIAEKILTARIILQAIAFEAEEGS